MDLIHFPFTLNTLSLLPQCKHSLVFLLLPFLRYICIYIYICVYIYIIYICTPIDLRTHTRTHTHTHTVHWQSFLCGLGQGLNNFLQFNRSAWPKWVILVSYCSLFKIEFGHRKRTGTWTFSLFWRSELQSAFQSGGCKPGVQTRLACEHDWPALEFDRMVRNLGKRLPLILSFVSFLFTFFVTINAFFLQSQVLGPRSVRPPVCFGPHIWSLVCTHQ